MLTSRFYLSLGILAILALQALPASAQDPDPPLGPRPYDSFNAGNIDQISDSTGGLAVNIPLVSYPQRGGKLKLSFALHYENRGAYEQETCILGHCTWYWLSRGSGFETIETENMFDNSVAGLDHGAGWVVHQPMGADGSLHPMGVIGSTFETLDGTGIQLSSSGVMITPGGVRTSAPGAACNSANQGYYMYNRANIGCESALREDPNGNKVSFSSTSGWTDTIGRVIPLPVAASTSTCPSGPLPVASAQVWNLLGPSGGTYSITFCYASVSTTYGFAANGGSQVTANYSQLQTVALPNGTNWTFNYDSWGDLSQITFPTGGTLAYTWTEFVCATVGQPAVAYAIYSRTLNDNVTGNATWTYTPISCSGTNPRTSSMAVTDPLGNDTVHNSSGLGATNLSVDFFETQALYYQGSHTTGTLLKTVNTTYSSVVVQLANTYPSQVFQVLPTQVTTIWPNNQQTAVAHSYDTGHTFTCPDSAFCVNSPFTYGRHVADREYDVGTGAPGSLLRTTTTNYLAFANSNYLNNDMMNLASNITISNGLGVQAGYTSYTYDSGSRVSSGITTQRDTSPPTSPYFGNPSSVSRWESGTAVSTTNCPYSVTNGNITSSATFFDTGMLDVATDPCGHTTTYSYSSSFAGAYPTTIANALSQSTSANFDFNTGLTISATDLNSRTTGYTYDASTWRPTQINNPDGGQTTVCYTDVLGSSCYQSGVFEFIATQKMNSSQSKITTTVFDGLGRPIQTQLNSDPDGADYTATAYDPLGRVSKQYNPTRCSPPTTNCGESTWGFTTYAYDALGRTTSVTAQDGSITTTVYSGNASTVTDPAGVSRESVTDGLGRLTQLFENPAVFNYETDYTYDALNNLLTVNQKGGSTNSAYWRTRTFAYDSLSRLTSALNPESGTVSYTYDENGNLLQKTSPAPDQTGSTTVALSYCYDALNRITGKAYTAQSCPLSSPVASYSYDQTSYGGLTITNGIGRRTGMADQAGTEAWSYDSMGRPLVDQRTTNSLTKSTTYVYLPYVDGSVNTITYPSGRTLTYITGAAERLLSGQDSSTSVYYVSGAHYNAPGALSSLTNGSAVYSTQLYNSRLQPCWLYATTGTALATNTACTASDPTPGNILDLNYNFNFGSADNGNVIGVSNNRSATRSQSFTYDALNRIAAAETTSTYATSPANCWGEAYFYDNLTTAGGAWGNLTAISPPSSAYTGCVQESGLSVSVSQNNQLSQSSNFCYDSAGNLVLQTACPTGSFTPTYSYDAENHLISTAGVNYVYDGDGRRVEKSVSGSVTKIYWYDPSGQVLDETDGSGSATNSAFNEYVFFNGQRIVRRDSSNDAFYYFTDHLGTSRTIAEIPAGQSSATLCYDADFYPFGGERTPIVNTCSQNYKFTGKERDAESNLDNFGARYNSFQWARFLSPDPGNIGASNDDPQSWNAYAYVRNNPANLADPSGAIYCRPASAGEINGGVSMVCDVTDAQYAYSSPKQQSAYDEAGYQHFDCSCDTEKDKDAYQHPNGISNDYIGDLIVLAAALAIVRSLDSPPERLPQDVKREQEYPDPPEARDSGKIGTNPNQKAALDRDIAQMKRDGYTDIRVNQEQVNAQGVRVGQGRPDLQGTDPNNVRQIIEYDQDPARSAAHVARIKANDPAAVVTPKIIK